MEVYEAVKTIALGALTVFVILGASFWIYGKLSKRLTEKSGSNYHSQLLMLGMSLLALILVLVALPMDNELRGQLLSLTGILLSAVIALASTTFVGNVMAGAMLRTIRNCRPGDYIEITEFAGRLSEMDLLHCEIQTEESDLVTLPNLYMVTNPMKVLRSTGTQVTATLSLGYDVPRKDIEEQLILAAEKAGLETPLVQIRELGDFSVTYRIAGILTDTKTLLSTRARLLAAVLDQLHEANIEIVSPTFMNQRQYTPETSFIPVKKAVIEDEVAANSHDEAAFDKAEKAESIETLRASHAEVVASLGILDEQLKEAQTEEQKTQLLAQIEEMKGQVEQWQQAIKAREEQLKKEV